MNTKSRQLEQRPADRPDLLAPARYWQTETALPAGMMMRPATIDDLDRARALFDAASLATIGQREVSLEQLRSEWTMPEFDLASSTQLVLTPQGEAVGYVEVWDINSPPVKIWIWGRVHPDYEGQGIGSSLMNWAEDRARQALARVPSGLRVIMEAKTVSHHQPAHDLFRAIGMEPVRYFLTMAIELHQRPPEPQWPAGISVRTVRGLSELEAVLHAVRDAFRDHWGHFERPFEEDYRRWRHFLERDELFDPTLWHLALDGDQIAGVSLCKPRSHHDEAMGWISTLGVRRPWRRQGLGLALLQHSLGEFYRRATVRVGLDVDGKSLTGATRLYRKAGMSELRRYDLYAKELRPGKIVSRTEIG